MKKFLVFVMLLLFTPFLMKKVNAEEKTNDFVYYSESNKPVFYGSTSIKFELGMVDSFDIDDMRFKIFAKDFEDGDLTSSIEVLSNNVNVDTVGVYSVSYKVVDSHSNESRITVPVEIVSDNNDKFTITRTLYTTPSVWNIALIGSTRGDNHDRQNLGIYLPAGVMVKVKPLQTTKNVQLTLLNNDSAKEQNFTINKGSSDYTEAMINKPASTSGRGEAIEGNYSSVPFFRTSVMDRGQALNQTFDLEIEYGLDAKELDFYRYFGDEESFREKWDLSQNDYAVIESDYMTLLVPFYDRDKMTNYYKKGFESLDKYFLYYEKVVEEYDSMLGLEYKPESPVDQNVRTKLFVKANYNGAGSAYYGADHIGVNSKSMSAFFEMNWGGLHEIAHGYQGTLGKGVMNLGEVGNNIFCYYVQKNKDIYTYEGDWLNKLGKEEAYNESRLEIGSYGEALLTTRLYALINIFDSFEGEESVKGIYKYYRNLLIEGKTIDNSDCYALFFKDVYNANILPYLEAWKIGVSDSVKTEIYSSNATPYNILNTVAGNSDVNGIMNQENMLKYQLVSDDIIKKYNIKSDITININPNDIKYMNNKYALLKYKGEIISSEVISNNRVTFENVLAGSYEIVFPVDMNYIYNPLYINATDTNQSISYKIEKRSTKKLDTTLRIKGIYDTYGYKLELSNNNQTGVITLGGANLGNQNSAWASKPNEEFASVRIYDLNNQVISEEKALGNGYFNYNKKPYTVDLEYGYKVVLYHADPSKVQMVLNENGSLLDYSTTLNSTTYIVTEDGLQIMDDSRLVKDAIYDAYKETVIDFLKNYFDNVKDEELNFLSENILVKQEVAEKYNFLKEADRKEFAESIRKVLSGGKPVITLADKITINQGDTIDYLAFITAFDNEDRDMILNNVNTTIVTNVNTGVAGIYDVTYTVTDSNNNQTSKSTTIEVLAKENGEEDKKEDSNNTGVIIACVIGGIVLLGACVFVVIRHKKHNN